MAYLVVRIRGTVNIPHWANTTLNNLNLDKRFRATIVAENPQSLGMLRKIKEIVAWTSVDANSVKELLEKKGRKNKVTLLRTMLAEIGVDSYYVLINSNRGVVIPNFSSALGFNHVILAIRLPVESRRNGLWSVQQDAQRGTLLYFDPTDTLVPLGMLPAARKPPDELWSVSFRSRRRTAAASIDGCHAK